MSKSELYFFVSFFFISFVSTMNDNKTILTITGSDSTGGSGVQADIKTISDLGGYAVSAITSITVQNTLGIQQFYDIPANIVEGQIEAIINDIQPEIVKIGMIRRSEVLDVVVNSLKRYKPHYIIYDPLIFSSCGDVLMSKQLVKLINEKLIPLCDFIVMRKEEQQYITYAQEVILLDETQMHGMTNRFSSALAVYLSRGENKDKAISLARQYINKQIVPQSNLKGRSSMLYNDFINAVSQFCKQNNDVHFYADHLNVSSRYLAQVTKRISNKAPKNIIDEYLIKEIESLLRTTDNTVQEIAYQCGLSSQAHLTKFFKKIKGITPSEYRKG